MEETLKKINDAIKDATPNTPFIFIGFLNNQFVMLESINNPFMVDGMLDQAKRIMDHNMRHGMEVKENKV